MINSDIFKQAMSQYAAGVTVITTVHQEKPIGITATSFSSLSLDPPLVIVNLSKKLFTHQVILESGIFAVNMLKSSQKELGMRFAGMIPGVEDRFEGLDVKTAVTNSPILTNSLAWVDCRVWATYEGGDHTIFVGEVVDVNSSSDGVPLVYSNRQWQGVSELEGNEENN
ncbi:MAG: flavin reductase [Chloroflexi bacterium]|nr:MAG: flavin reductase [Chloroflexota bacterium]